MDYSADGLSEEDAPCKKSVPGFSDPEWRHSIGQDSVMAAKSPGIYLKEG